MKKTLLSTVLAILISTSAVMAQTAGASVAGVGAATAGTNDAAAGSVVAGSAVAAAGAPVDTATKLKEFCKKCAVDATYTDATMPNLTCDAACN